MPQMAQHQAAELWELCRDHAVAGAKLRALASSCQDASLRQTIERHAGAFQQAAQRLMSFLQEGSYGAHAGAYGQTTAHPYGQGTAGTWQWQGAASWQSPYQAQWQAGPGAGATWQAQTAGYGTNPPIHGTNQFHPAGVQAQPLDIALASDCLRMCKTFAVQCIWGATECAEPARSYLYQLAGQHLQMAMDHYRWLEQHQVYASPRIDPQAAQEYVQKLGQLVQVGQAVAAQGLAPANRVAAPAGMAAATAAGQGGGYAGSSFAHPADHQAGYGQHPGSQVAGTHHAYATPSAYARV